MKETPSGFAPTGTSRTAWWLRKSTIVNVPLSRFEQASKRPSAETSIRLLDDPADAGETIERPRQHASQRRRNNQQRADFRIVKITGSPYSKGFLGNQKNPLSTDVKSGLCRNISTTLQKTFLGKNLFRAAEDKLHFLRVEFASLIGVIRLNASALPHQHRHFGVFGDLVRGRAS